MNLREQIKRVLNEETDKSLIIKIIRRLDLDWAIDKCIKFVTSHNRYENLKKLTFNDFSNEIIYNIWVDYISPIFEEYEDDENGWAEVDITISGEQQKVIEDFLRTHYKDKLKDAYKKIFQ